MLYICCILYSYVLYMHISVKFAAAAYNKEFKAFMTVVSNTFDLFEVDLSSSVYSVVQKCL